MYKYVHIYVFKYNSPYMMQDVFWNVGFLCKVTRERIDYIYTKKTDDNANLSEPI